LVEINKQGGVVLYGGKTLEINGGNFVEPTIIEVRKKHAYAQIKSKYICT
jgi:hypothetical protein